MTPHEYYTNATTPVDLVDTWNLRYRIPDGPVTANTPPASTTATPAADTAGGGDTAETAPESNGLSPDQQINTAIADGVIADDERDLASAANKTLIESVVSRLNTATEGHVDGQRPGGRYAVPSQHGEDRAELAEGPNLDELDDQIAQRTAEAERYTGSAADAKRGYINQLEQQRDQRSAAETEMVGHVEDKVELVGALELQREQLDGQRPADAQHNYRALREEAAPFLEDFVRYDGQDYSPDLVGDDWDSVDNYDFDRMVEQFHGQEHEINVWVEHQDNEDAKASVLALADIMRRYETARGQSDDIDHQIGEIETRQQHLRDSVADDLEVLSPQTKFVEGTENLRPEFTFEGAPSAGGQDNNPPTTGEADTPPTDNSGTTTPETPTTGSSPSGTTSTGTTTTTTPATTPSTGSDAAPDPSQVTPEAGTESTAPTSPEPAPEAPTPPPAPTEQDVVAEHAGLGPQYTVVSGDTLTDIANRYNQAWGTTIQYPQIQAANPQIVNPNLIYPGQVFQIPGIHDRISSIISSRVSGV